MVAYRKLRLPVTSQIDPKDKQLVGQKRSAEDLDCSSAKKIKLNTHGVNEPSNKNSRHWIGNRIPAQRAERNRSAIPVILEDTDKDLLTTWQEIQSSITLSEKWEHFDRLVELFSRHKAVPQADDAKWRTLIEEARSTMWKLQQAEWSAGRSLHQTSAQGGQASRLSPPVAAASESPAPPSLLEAQRGSADQQVYVRAEPNRPPRKVGEARQTETGTVYKLCRHAKNPDLDPGHEHCEWREFHLEQLPHYSPIVLEDEDRVNVNPRDPNFGGLKMLRDGIGGRPHEEDPIHVSKWLEARLDADMETDPRLFQYYRQRVQELRSSGKSLNATHWQALLDVKWKFYPNKGTNSHLVPACKDHNRGYQSKCIRGWAGNRGGPTCPYSHDLDAYSEKCARICKGFANGYCPAGDWYCSFLHIAHPGLEARPPPANEVENSWKMIETINPKTGLKEHVFTCALQGLQDLMFRKMKMEEELKEMRQRVEALSAAKEQQKEKTCSRESPNFQSETLSSSSSAGTKRKRAENSDDSDGEIDPPPAKKLKSKNEPSDAAVKLEEKVSDEVCPGSSRVSSSSSAITSVPLQSTLRCHTRSWEQHSYDIGPSEVSLSTKKTKSTHFNDSGWSIALMAMPSLQCPKSLRWNKLSGVVTTLVRSFTDSSKSPAWLGNPCEAADESHTDLASQQNHENRLAYSTSRVPHSTVQEESEPRAESRKPPVTHKEYREWQSGLFGAGGDKEMRDRVRRAFKKEVQTGHLEADFPASEAESLLAFLKLRRPGPKDKEV